MSNKKTSLIVFCIIISILLIVATICIISSKTSENGNESKLLKMYEKVKDNQNFTFTMEEKNEELDYKVSMLQRGTDVSIDMHTNGEHTTTLILEKEAYYIMHDEEEYYDFGDEEVESDIFIGGLEEMTQKDYESGKENINGKTYYYEEYDNAGDKFIIFGDINSESKIKTRFYFDKDNLVYIKNIIKDKDEEYEETIKASIKYEIDESLFILPEEYAEVE